MLEIKLKLFYLWIKKRKNAAIGCLVALIAILLICVIVHKLSPQYYYIDLNGNKGVSNKCWEGECGLYCRRENDGKISVQQYWKGD